MKVLYCCFLIVTCSGGRFIVDLYFFVQLPLKPPSRGRLSHCILSGELTCPLQKSGCEDEFPCFKVWELLRQNKQVKMVKVYELTLWSIFLFTSGSVGSIFH